MFEQVEPCDIQWETAEEYRESGACVDSNHCGVTLLLLLLLLWMNFNWALGLPLLLRLSSLLRRRDLLLWALLGDLGALTRLRGAASTPAAVPALSSSAGSITSPETSKILRAR